MTDEAQTPNFSPITAAAVQDFKTKNDPQNRDYLDVDDWRQPDGTPWRVYRKPWTIATKRKISQLADQQDNRMWLEALYAGGVDAQDNPLFDRVNDGFALENHVDERVIRKIGEWLLQLDERAARAQEGN